LQRSEKATNSLPELLYKTLRVDRYAQGSAALSDDPYDDFWPDTSF